MVGQDSETDATQTKLCTFCSGQSMATALSRAGITAPAELRAGLGFQLRLKLSAAAGPSGSPPRAPGLRPLGASSLGAQVWRREPAGTSSPKSEGDCPRGVLREETRLQR